MKAALITLGVISILDALFFYSCFRNNKEDEDE